MFYRGIEGSENLRRLQEFLHGELARKLFDREDDRGASAGPALHILIPGNRETLTS